MGECPSELGTAGVLSGARTATRKWWLFGREEAKKKRRASEERAVGDCANYSGPFLEFFGVFRQLLGHPVVALRGMDLAQELQGLS